MQEKVSLVGAVKSGISGLDNITGGFRTGELTAIVSKPSVGKSAFTLNVAVSAAQAGCVVGYVCNEMGVIGIGQRLISRLGMVDGTVLRKRSIDEQSRDKIENAVACGRELPIQWMFDYSTVEGITSIVHEQMRGKGMDLLIVDCLQLMESRYRLLTEYDRLVYITKTLRKTARRENIPVILLMQPMPSEPENEGVLREADSILHLEECGTYSDSDVDEFGGLEGTRIKNIRIDVSRQYRNVYGRVDVAFIPEYMLYTSIGRE